MDAIDCALRWLVLKENMKLDLKKRIIPLFLG